MLQATERPDPKCVPVPPPSRPDPPQFPSQPLAPPAAGPLPYPAVADPVLDRLLAERIVYLGGELDTATAHRVTAQLLLLAAQDPTREITLYLSCPGGSAAAALAVHDTMRAIGPEVATCAVGLVASAGQFLLIAGTPGKRHALPHARVVLCRTAAGPGGVGSADVLADQRREVVELTASYVGAEVATVAADVDAARWFTSEQAMEYGLVDHIGAP